MEFIQQFDGVLLFIVLFSIVAYFDKKFDFNLLNSTNRDEFNILGFNNESKKHTYKESEASDKEQDIIQLKQRIEILEKIVTDPQEQLRREIDSLK